MNQASIQTDSRHNGPDPPAAGTASPPTVHSVTHSPVQTKATYCYPNQFIDAGRIYQHFCNGGSHYATFIAEMQSGKTGTYLELVAQMLLKKKVEKVYIICGCNEKELCDQLKQAKADCIEDVNMNDLIAVDNDDSLNEVDKSRKIKELLNQNKLKTQVSNQVEVIWSRDLKSGKRDLTEAERHQTKLIIWDESHYAEKHTNLPALWWKRNGIYRLLHASDDDIAAANAPAPTTPYKIPESVK